nr:hypothetical protein [Tanacetum cinerariifolium]
LLRLNFVGDSDCDSGIYRLS